MDFAGKLITLVLLGMLYEFNYADDNPPYYRIYPPFSHQNSNEKACIADFGPITRGQHRFLGPKCQILYCPPDPNVKDITVIECEDYLKETNLPKNFPDTEKRMYLKICEFCKPCTPTIDLDLMQPDSTIPLSERTSTTQPPTKPTTSNQPNIKLNFYDN